MRHIRDAYIKFLLFLCTGIVWTMFPESSMEWMPVALFFIILEETVRALPVRAGTSTSTWVYLLLGVMVGCF